MRIQFTVHGLAQSAGSKRAFAYKKADGSGKLGVRVADMNPKAAEWKNLVRDKAAEAMAGVPLLDGPLCLEVIFFRPRPKGHYGSGRNAQMLKAGAARQPTTAPDTTKLVRCLEDALTGVVWRDDSQVVIQHAEKWYGDPARCEVAVEPAIAADYGLRTNYSIWSKRNG